MGRRVDPNKRITQRSIGFNFYQIMFFNKYPDFQPDEYCRKAIDEQIKLIDKEFLPEEKRDNDEEIK